MYLYWNSLSRALPLGFFFVLLGKHNGRSRISGKGVHMYKGVGVRFDDFISFFLNISWKWNNLVSLRPNYLIFIGYLNNLVSLRSNYLIFIGYLKWGGREEGPRETLWTPSGSAAEASVLNLIRIIIMYNNKNHTLLHLPFKNTNVFSHTD